MKIGNTIIVVLCAGSFSAVFALAAPPTKTSFDADIARNAQKMLEEGKKTFRFETFGSEAFWGDALQLHKAIAGEKNGGVGPGVSPKTALSVGLKVDADALPDALKKQIAAGKVNLDDPATTIALLKLNAVVGVTAFANPDGSIKSMGIQCAFCHSTVDNSFAPGIGKRLDGWANRDLNVGAIVSLAPNLDPFTDLLGVDVETVKKVLASWGPGRYDAFLNKDGKAFGPHGKQAGTLIPPAFGLAGVDLATSTGSGSVTYWNAYVGVTQMHGSGTYFDARFNNKDQYPVSAKSGSWNTRATPDRVTAKLAALHFYQLSIAGAESPGRVLRQGCVRAREDGLQRPREVRNLPRSAALHRTGTQPACAKRDRINSFQADRSPTHMYRTAPLAGLWTHQEGGFFHDGRFATLLDVVDHYDTQFKLNLSDANKKDLIEYLKGI